MTTDFQPGPWLAKLRVALRESDDSVFVELSAAPDDKVIDFAKGILQVLDMPLKDYEKWARGRAYKFY